MKTVTIIMLLVILFVGCAEPKVINGVEYQPYGLLNQDEEKCPNIRYKADIPNVIIASLFIETIIIPVYIVGWALFEPKGEK